MLVTIQHWPTMAICSTSTIAAINVTSLSPNWEWSMSGMRLKKKRGYQRERAQRECNRQQLRHAEEPQLGVGCLHQNDGATEREQLRQQQSQARESAWYRPRQGKTERPEAVNEERHQYELLDGRAPLDESEVRAGVFEDHRLVNHR